MSKKLGQHFLKSSQIARTIVDFLGIQPGDTVVEIGGGTGALTRNIVDHSSPERLIVIEKDTKLAELLTRNFQYPISTTQIGSPFQISKSQNAILHGDVLEVLPQIEGEYKLIGNIPYYITGKLLRVISELKHRPSTTVLMIQKEVAERLVAHPPKMNLLAASVQVWADVQLLLSVSRREFTPQPKVHSAVVSLKTKDCDLTKSQMDSYYSFIRILFQQPRKTIVNNLSAGYDMPKDEVIRLLKTLHVDEHSRPQNLSISLIKNLSQMV